MTVKIYDLDNVVINSDNADNHAILEGLGAVEVDLANFSGQEAYLNYLCESNTKKVGDKWVFTPDIAGIEAMKAEALYDVERLAARAILADHGLGEVADEQMDEVKAYLKSVKPGSQQRIKLSRPSVMDKYSPLVE